MRKCTTALLSTIYDGHLGCFQILVIVNNAAMNVGVRLFFELMSPVSLDMLPEVRSLGQKAVPFLIFLKRFYLFIFREGVGREKESERNTNVWLSVVCPLLGTWPATQACALTGNPTSDPLVHRSALNPLSHSSQRPFKNF